MKTLNLVKIVLVFLMVVLFGVNCASAGITTIIQLSSDPLGYNAWVVKNSSVDIFIGTGSGWITTALDVTGGAVKNAKIGMELINLSDANFRWPGGCDSSGFMYAQNKFSEHGWTDQANRGWVNNHGQALSGVGFGWKGTFQKNCDSLYVENCYPANLPQIPPPDCNKFYFTTGDADFFIKWGWIFKKIKKTGGIFATQWGSPGYYTETWGYKDDAAAGAEVVISEKTPLKQRSATISISRLSDITFKVTSVPLSDIDLSDKIVTKGAPQSYNAPFLGWGQLDVGAYVPVNNMFPVSFSEEDNPNEPNTFDFIYPYVYVANLNTTTGSQKMILNSYTESNELVCSMIVTMHRSDSNDKYLSDYILPVDNWLNAGRFIDRFGNSVFCIMSEENGYLTIELDNFFGDFDNDGIVSLVDFVYFASAWGLGSSQAGYKLALDSDSDGAITMEDFIAFCNNWLAARPKNVVNLKDYARQTARYETVYFLPSFSALYLKNKFFKED
jgi:hypothetical protein